MAVTVTNAHRDDELTKGRDVTIKDGHLTVLGAWDPNAQEHPTIAVYAPGFWQSAEVKNS